MITTLLQAAEGMTRGAAKMMETDPHGWTLTVVCVSVVFAGLLVLYLIYSLSGEMFSGRFNRALKRMHCKKAESGDAAPELAGHGSDEELAAAIAVALYLEDGGSHDDEPGIITIASGRSNWADKSLTFRKRPIK